MQEIREDGTEVITPLPNDPDARAQKVMEAINNKLNKQVNVIQKYPDGTVVTVAGTDYITQSDGWRRVTPKGGKE